ncbi:MAG TPA: hypothetical protein DCL48_17135, partial [Alphaproteobacteria bacterium]|nr:hypothetical protein [Alphaproteobacteria bacterium]
DGLAGVLIQSAVFGALVALVAGQGHRAAAGIIAGLAVFSHWVLDVVTHRPDMMLFGADEKIGAGLWNHPNAAMTVELGLIAAAFALYALLTRPKAGSGMTSLAVLAVGLALLQAINWFGPPPNPLTTPINEIALQGLAAFGVLIGLAWWVERTREPAD